MSSVDPSNPPSIDADQKRLDLWIVESERRLDAVDAGRMKTFDAEEVYRELRDRP
jgi:hypothetical protein